MFGLEDEGEPLEAVLSALRDPLEPLQGLDPEERRQLAAILERTDSDYLAMADAVAALLGTADWHWPELAARAEADSSPLEEAAAYLVLSSATRRQATDTLRSAAEAGAQVRVEASEDGPCGTCRPQVGPARTPLAQAHRGLPPYHLGCRCRMAIVRG